MGGGFYESIGINHYKSESIRIYCYFWISNVPIIIQKVGGVREGVNNPPRESVLRTMRTPKGSKLREDGG